MGSVYTVQCICVEGSVGSECIYSTVYMCGGSVGSVYTVQCICVEGVWVVCIQYSVYVWRECG